MHVVIAKHSIGGAPLFGSQGWKWTDNKRFQFIPLLKLPIHRVVVKQSGGNAPRWMCTLRNANFTHSCVAALIDYDIVRMVLV